jgi:D-arabinose 1-dehydrogenase-like Zn-dependent alcohol dehydrogenase
VTGRIAAYAAPAPKPSLVPFEITRRDPGPDDVRIEILYCGVCHSDIHQVRDEWFSGIFPMVPGHEIVGRVTKVGEGVTKLAPGDRVGVVGLGGLGHMAVKLAGSMIGGIAETQEMLDFCGAKKITADVEIIPIREINEACERTIRSDVRYRFVIDIATLKRA